MARSMRVAVQVGDLPEVLALAEEAVELRAENERLRTAIERHRATQWTLSPADRLLWAVLDEGSDR